MNAEHKRQWVAALRSGKYERCYGRLRRGHTEMCAIGVLCDTVSPYAWKRYRTHTYTYRGMVAGLDFALRRLTGLNMVDELLVSRMNDSGGPGDPTYSWDEIADHIEENL